MSKYKWVRIYDHEFNNGHDWGYTEKNSRVFRTRFLEAKVTPNGVFGKLEGVNQSPIDIKEISSKDLNPEYARLVNENWEDLI